MNLYLIVETRDPLASAGIEWASELALKLKEGDARVGVFLVENALLAAQSAIACESGGSIGNLKESGDTRGIVQLGGWTIDMPARTISHGHRSSRVSPKAIRVLRELLYAAGSVVSRDRLMEAAWSDVTVGEEAVTHAVAELRRAFQQTSGGTAPLATIYKSGYRLLDASQPADPAPHEDDRDDFAPLLAARPQSERDGSENAHEPAMAAVTRSVAAQLPALAHSARSAAARRCRRASCRSLEAHGAPCFRRQLPQ